MYKAQVDLVSVYKKNSANYRGNGGVEAIDMDIHGEPLLLPHETLARQNVDG